MTKKKNTLSRREFFRKSGLLGAGALFPLGRSRTGVLLQGLIPADEMIPGVSHWLTSTCGECHAGCGVNVRVRDGNAVKIEGNERHPVNRGGLCARGQSALQALYSPARISAPLRRAEAGRFEKISWADAGTEIAGRLGSGASSSKKIAIVSSRLTGALRALIGEHASDMPQAEFIVHEPMDYAAMAAANKLCFGIEAVPTYRIDRARTVVSFGADLFETWLSPVGNAAGFGRLHDSDGGAMGRLIQIEAHLSLTGANADDRYCVPPGAETFVILAIAAELLNDDALPPQQAKRWRQALEPFGIGRATEASGISPQTIRQIADRLRAGTPSLVIAGGPTCRSSDATAVQTAINLINYLAASYGQTITFDRTENAPLGTHSQLNALVGDMEAGTIEALVVHETDPYFSFPQPERLRDAMKRVPLKVYLASVNAASGDLYDMILPAHHWLERWDMVETRSGLHGVQQPVIRPWCDSRHAGQVLSDIFLAWAGKPGIESIDYESSLKERWERIRVRDSAGGSFGSFWRETLGNGGYWAEPVRRKVSLDARAAEAIEALDPAVPASGTRILLPVPTVRHGAGRQTGRPWLNEMPDPITTIAWDTPALISPATAAGWKCRSGDVVEIACGGNILKTPVHVQAGTSDGVVAVPFGTPNDDYLEYHYDDDSHPLHRLAGAVDTRSGALSWTGTPITFRKVLGRTRLAYLQGHDDQNGRGIARTVALADIGGIEKKRGKHESAHGTDLYPKHVHPVHDWAMAVDLSACIGCGACAVACQAENNVPVVGKEQCLLGRELSWLRIERFVDRGRIVFLPMMCQHCEHAPCETVCPVYASVHSSEGLNQQVYNRCVGTRYCANNCPYKVRRFNWYTYKTPTPLDRQFNPDVFIRTRGIMEKCTFCVQRIREYKEIAKDEKRPLRDGEITPACAQSCPTNAIAFGDLNDPTSRVSGLLKDPRRYYIFEQLNTQPSVIYLKRVYHADATPVKSL